MSRSKRFRVAQRAPRYVEVTTPAGTEIVGDMATGISRLVDHLGVPGDRAPAVRTFLGLVRGARQPGSFPSLLDGERWWHGVVALHAARGGHIITWFHECGWRGIEILVGSSRTVAQRRLRAITDEIRPNQYVSPRNAMGLSNLRPWRQLPDDAESCFGVSASIDDEPLGDVIIHRWRSPKGERWLVTFDDDDQVVGDHPNLRTIAANLDKRYYWGFEVDQMRDDVPWP